jgi:hypothetical protein
VAKSAEILGVDTQYHTQNRPSSDTLRSNSRSTIKDDKREQWGAVGYDDGSAGR